MSTSWLYSPVNFVTGLQAWLLGRAQLDLPQALAEAERESPRWGYRLAASLVTGLLVLYAIFSALPQAAGPAMTGLSGVVTGKQAAIGVAAAVAAFGLLVAVVVARRAWTFYAHMCQIGYAVRYSR